MCPKTTGPSCSKRRWLNKFVKGHFVNCFSEFNIQYSDIFCIFELSLDVNSNKPLTDDIVSFEQLGPDVWQCRL